MMKSPLVCKTNGSTIDVDDADIEGDNNTITGNGCLVRGEYNIITGDRCVVEGDTNHIYGNRCRAWGNHNFVKGDECCVFGNGTVSKGDECYLHGKLLVSLGDYCVIGGTGGWISGARSAICGTGFTIRGRGHRCVTPDRNTNLDAAPLAAISPDEYAGLSSAYTGRYKSSRAPSSSPPTFNYTAPDGSFAFVKGGRNNHFHGTRITLVDMRKAPPE